MEDKTVDRRTMLQLLGAAGTTALAGCSSGGDGGNGDAGTSNGGTATSGPGDHSAPTATETEENARMIEDTFEDGELFSDPEWEVDSCECAGEATVVDRESPDGGSKVFRLVDGQDPDQGVSNGKRVELQSGAPWAPEAWTLEGQFYLESYPDIDKGPTRTFISVSNIDFSPGGIERTEYDTMHLNHEGPSMGKEESISAPALEEGNWYDYTIAHDGEGTYTATRHKLDSDGNRADSHEISITSEAPKSNANIEFFAKGGQGSREEGGNPIAIEHSYVRWEAEADSA